MANSESVNFFIVGMQKAGTTALHSFLSRHPDVEMSKRKEIHFFDDEAMDWGAPDYDQLHSHFAWCGDRLRGEATPIYSFWPNSMERLHAYNPEAKLIVLLRHPTYRAFSHWKMEVVRNVEPLSFAEAITTGASRMTGQNDQAKRHFSYVERGFYASQITRIFQLFGRSSVYFARTDDLWNAPNDTMGAIEEFLGVGRALNVGREYIIAASTDANAELDQHSREKLDELYRAQIQETAALSGLDLSNWLNAEYSEPLRSQAA